MNCFSNIHLMRPQRLFDTMETFLQVLQIALQRVAESLTIFGESSRPVGTGTQLHHLIVILKRLPLGSGSIGSYRNSRRTIQVRVLHACSMLLNPPPCRQALLE